MSTSTRNKLELKGFADSRIYALASAAEKLHSACCPLDSHNLELFTEQFGGPLGIFKFMAAFSEGEHGTRTIRPLKTCESCADDIEQADMDPEYSHARETSTSCF